MTEMETYRCDECNKFFLEKPTRHADDVSLCRKCLLKEVEYWQMREGKMIDKYNKLVDDLHKIKKVE